MKADEAVGAVMGPGGIIPRPNGPLRSGDGSLSCAGGIRAENAGFEPWCLAAFGRRLLGRGIPSGRGQPLVLRRDPSLPAEAYTLRVAPEGISLAAGDERGVVQALTSLYLCIDGEGGVPLLSLEDGPRYGWRGFMLDSARHFFDAGEVERIIEEMALAKLNVFHWHLSDDQGWRMESRVFPELNGIGGGLYTQEEIRRIVGFARERGVLVVPELDVPGHVTALLSVRPELSCRGEKVALGKGPGIYPTILCAGKEEVHSFLCRLLDEALSLFDSPLIHLGGDEAPKGEWEGCPRCGEVLRREGLSGWEDLQGYFARRLADHLASRGRRALFWNDLLKSKTLPEDMDLQFWLDPEPTGALEAFSERAAPGGKVVFSDMFRLYLDYPESFIPLRRVYGCEPAIGGRAGHPALAGLEACLWSERVSGPEALERAVFPRLFAVAEAAWTVDRDYADFEGRLAGKLRSLEGKGIAFTPLEKCNPRGEARLGEIALLLEQFRTMMGGENAPPPEAAARLMGLMVRGFDLPPLPGI